MLDPGKFRSLVGRTLFVNERDRQNNLRGVMISDRTDPTNPFVIFSERGRFSYDDVRQTFTLGLEDGALHLDADPNVPERVRTIAFEALDYSFDVSALIPTLTAAVRPRQMTFDELEDVVRRAREGSDLGDLHQRDPIEYELEIHRRYALPMAPMAFALIAVPLGLRRAARTRSRGALISLILAFAYYGLFSQARFLALDGGVAAHYALWIPNLVFGVIAVLLALRVRHVIAD
jgi:lipopolysaccharide export LptBFGC system permease protein LptF